MAIMKILIKMNLSEEIKFCGEIICSNREGEREREKKDSAFERKMAQLTAIHFG